METVTFFSTLLRLAREQAKAEKSGDAEQIRIAKQRHEDYRQLCLKADRMVIPQPRVENR